MIALDQRGHGYSDHARSYSRSGYLGDIAAIFERLDLRRAVMLGNSLGGVNAYQFAAQYPDLASALVIEDIGAEISDDLPVSLAWAGIFASREELAARIGPGMVPYFKDSFRETENGWRLAFDPRDMILSGNQLKGDHWADWLATDCPALLIRGTESSDTSPSEMERMASKRKNTRLCPPKAGTSFISTIQTASTVKFKSSCKQFECCVAE